MRYDLVSIGGGLSGLVAACRAAELGAKVAVLEQASEDRYQCSSRYTTGVINVMGKAILAEPDTLYDAILKGSGANADPALARAVADNAKRAIEWLRSLGTRFIQRGLQQDQPGQQVLAPRRRRADAKSRSPYRQQRRKRVARRASSISRDGGRCLHRR